MDIFTTQLARVVPVKIRPSKLKVKALAKDAAASKLTEDDQHLEDHPSFHASANNKKSTVDCSTTDNEESKTTHEEPQPELEKTKELSYGPQGKVAVDKKENTGTSPAAIKHLDITDESQSTEPEDSSINNEQTAASKDKEDDLAKSHKPPHLDIYI